MKNHKVVIIILSIILVICCIGIGWMISFDNSLDGFNSKENNLSLSCESASIKMNEEVTCTLKGHVTDYQVSAVSSTIESNSDFELIEVVPDSSWEGDGEMGDIDLYTDVNKSNDFNIVQFKISLTNEASSEIQINLLENSFFDENFEEHKIENIATTLTVEK